MYTSRNLVFYQCVESISTGFPVISLFGFYFSYSIIRHNMIYLYSIRLERDRDSLVVVLSGNGKEVGMNTLEVLTLVLVIFAALTYIDNKHNRK